jgi:hypothetical protein
MSQLRLPNGRRSWIRLQRVLILIYLRLSHVVSIGVLLLYTPTPLARLCLNPKSLTPKSMSGIRPPSVLLLSHLQFNN